MPHQSIHFRLPVLLCIVMTRPSSRAVFSSCKWLRKAGVLPQFKSGCKFRAARRSPLLVGMPQYSETLERDHPDNLTTLLIRPLFHCPILVLLGGKKKLRHFLDKGTTLLIWQILVRPKSGPIIKVPRYINVYFCEHHRQRNMYYYIQVLCN